MKRMLACLFIVAVLPSMTSQPVQHIRAGDGPLATVAFAGHTTSSTRAECTCELGADGVCPCCGYCINFIRAQDNAVDKADVQPGLSAPAQPASDSSLGSGELLFVLAIIAWSRIFA